VLYEPAAFGQYVHPDDGSDRANTIYTVVNETVLAAGRVNATIFSFEERGGCCGDEHMQAAYVGATMFEKAFSMLPLVVTLFFFFYLISQGRRRAQEVLSGNFPQYNHHKNVFYKECVMLATAEAMAGLVKNKKDLVEMRYADDAEGLPTCNRPSDLPVYTGDAYEVKVRLKGLIKMDWLSKSDPLVAAFVIKENSRECDYYVGQTEWLKDTHECAFNVPLNLYHRRDAGTLLRFVVFDVDSDQIIVSHDLMGWVDIWFDDLAKTVTTNMNANVDGCEWHKLVNLDNVPIAKRLVSKGSSIQLIVRHGAAFSEVTRGRSKTTGGDGVLGDGLEEIELNDMSHVSNDAKSPVDDDADDKKNSEVSTLAAAADATATKTQSDEKNPEAKASSGEKLKLVKDGAVASDAPSKTVGFRDLTGDHSSEDDELV
jgi:hypothetical protein